MSGYIERENDREYFCPASGTIAINPDSSTDTGVMTNNDENLGRWDWLISKWSKMSFKERMALFMPYFHYVNPRNNFKFEFDVVFQQEMVETSYKLCRSFKDFKFDPDGRGVPNIIMVFNPIDVSAIPDMEIRSDVRAWGQKYGFLKCECQNCRKTSEE